MTVRRLLPVLLTALIASGTAHAQISVNRSVIELAARSPVQDIEIYNGGSSKAYLDLSIAEIIRPGSAAERRVELDDPRTAPVLVSPRQLLVAPGSRKRVRVILRESSEDVDRVYRLRVEPYSGKARLPETEGADKKSAIRVLIGYDLLLLARPADAEPDVQVTRDARSIEFLNAGNSNVLLRRIVQCDAGVDPSLSEANEACSELAPNRLYAGETYRLNLPRQRDGEQLPVKVWQAFGLENSSAVF